SPCVPPVMTARVAWWRGGEAVFIGCDPSRKALVSYPGTLLRRCAAGKIFLTRYHERSTVLFEAPARCCKPRDLTSRQYGSTPANAALRTSLRSPAKRPKRPPARTPATSPRVCPYTTARRCART